MTAREIKSEPINKNVATTLQAWAILDPGKCIVGVALLATHDYGALLEHCGYVSRKADMLYCKGYRAVEVEIREVRK